MSNAKERYQTNRARVFEIMGIDPSDPDYNCHHVLFRSDFKENPHWNEDYQDSKANLFPMRIEDHERLHERVEELKERHEEEHQAPKRRTKYNLHDLGRLWDEGRFG